MSILLKSGAEFHKGKVVALHVDHNARLMSDVWGAVTYAVVYYADGVEDVNDSYRAAGRMTPAWGQYTPDQGMFVFVRIGDSEFGYNMNIASVEVDADAETLEIYAAWRRGKEMARAISVYDADEWRAQEYRRRVDLGKFVRVVKGRKVPKGTEGKVFWIGDKGFGPCIGLALPESDGTFATETRMSNRGKNYQSYKNVVFLAAGNVSVIETFGGRVL